MERTPSLISLSSSGSSGGSRSRNGDPLLPLNEKTCQPRQPQQIPRFKAVLGHCLYRRVVVWTLAGLALIAVVISRSQHVWVSDMVGYAKGSTGPVVESKPDISDKADGGAQKDLSNTALVVSVSDGSQISALEIEDDELSKEEDEKETEQFEKEANEKPWLRYRQ